MLPDYVEQALRTLTQAGYAAYLVGGCVRDQLMSRIPKDYDIASNAPIEVFDRLFDRVIPTGLTHGTVTVLIDGQTIEITRMRADGPYTDRRRPDSVQFLDDITVDLSRRDFTVNAMAIDGRNGLDVSLATVLDPFGGQADLTARLIRAVGDPGRRFDEDALRILRAFRFASVLDFTIEETTLAAALDRCPLLADIAAERVAAELMSLLCPAQGQSQRLAPQVLAPLMAAGGLTAFGLPACAARLDGLADLPSLREVRLSALVHLCGGNITKVCVALKTDKALRGRAAAFGRALAEPSTQSAAELKRQWQFLPRDLWLPALDTRRILLDEDNTTLAEEIDRALKEHAPFAISDLAIDGEFLKKMGFYGPEIGLVLDWLLADVFEHPAHNNPEKLALLADSFKKLQKN